MKYFTKKWWYFALGGSLLITLLSVLSIARVLMTHTWRALDWADVVNAVLGTSFSALIFAFRNDKDDILGEETALGAMFERIFLPFFERKVFPLIHSAENTYYDVVNGEVKGLFGVTLHYLYGLKTRTCLSVQVK